MVPKDSERKFYPLTLMHRRTSLRLFRIVAGPQNYFESLLVDKNQVGVNIMERCSIMGGNHDTGSIFFICLEFSEFAMYE